LAVCTGFGWDDDVVDELVRFLDRFGDYGFFLGGLGDRRATDDEVERDAYVVFCFSIGC
jgi:hypothetical protein